MDEYEVELLEDEPLSEEKRIQLIDIAVENKAKLETIPNLDGFYEYLLRGHMNDECLKCIRSKPNFGKCYGKVGGNPCLVFKGKGGQAHV